MLSQLAGFFFDCTCIILPTPIVHIDNYCYLCYSTLFISFTALYYVLHLSYTLKRATLRINHPFIHLFIHSFIFCNPLSLSSLARMVVTKKRWRSFCFCVGQWCSGAGTHGNGVPT